MWKKMLKFTLVTFLILGSVSFRNIGVVGDDEFEESEELPPTSDEDIDSAEEEATKEPVISERRKPQDTDEHKTIVDEANKEYQEGRQRRANRRSDDDGGFRRSDDRPPRRFDENRPRRNEEGGDGPRRFDDGPRRFDDGPRRFNDGPRRYDGYPRSNDRRRSEPGGAESHVGCVLFRLFKQADGGPGAEYLLLKGRRGDGWIPPKGYNLFETETGERDAALLKLHAKTGFRRDDVHVVPGFVKRTEYTFLDKVKTTVFYLAELLTPDVDMKRLSKYYTDFRWMTLDEAMSATRHKDIGEVIESCEEHLKKIKVIS